MKASELPFRCPLLHEQRPGRSRLRAVPVVIRALRDSSSLEKCLRAKVSTMRIAAQRAIRCRFVAGAGEGGRLAAFGRGGGRDRAGAFLLCGRPRESGGSRWCALEPAGDGSLAEAISIRRSGEFRQQVKDVTLIGKLEGIALQRILGG
jgi:hypothetical protein